jgi:hypothetical protein
MQEEGRRRMRGEETHGGTSRLRRVMAWSLIAFLGLGAGVVTMALTVPVATAVRLAGVQMPPDVVWSGTLMQGAAAARGHQLQWDVQGWPSLMARALVADLRVTGPETDLTGTVVLRPASAELAPLQGRTGWTLVDALMPGLDIRCDTVARVDVAQVAVSVAVRNAMGQVRLAAGTCDRADGTVTNVPLPALTAGIVTVEEGIQLVIAADAAPETPLGNLLLTPDDRLRITVHPAGAAMVPGLPVSGDSQVELPLALFTQ